MLEKRYDYKTREKYWQDKWVEEEVYKFNPNADKKYMIDTPPPSISGNIHLGHIFSYVQTDVIARHKRMSGFSVYYPFGYDDNGLPSERYVEKKLKIRLHELPREQIRETCEKTTDVEKEKYKNIFRSAGLSANFEKTYSSYSQNSQKISQQSFIELYEQGNIVRKSSASLWCPECRTAIAQAEVESVDIESAMNYISFGVKGSDERLQIGTTRPELLAACVCVFVHPKDKKRAHLIGKTAISPIYNAEVPILASDEVDLEKGTGAVMCCTFGDEHDAKWQKEYDLPVLEAIGYNGRMTALAGEFEGMKIAQAREAIIQKLKDLNILYKQEDLVHAVATHDRCGTPIEILARPQWFIPLLDKKEQIYQAGLDVKWYPGNMQKMFLNWVEGLKWDWCISRQRFFGVPIPVWYCAKCGEVILPKKEDLPVDPQVTKPKCVCPKCGSNEFKPETDVLDTWATSSLTPQLACDLITNKGLDDTYAPMDLRPNAHDIVRTWDFYTIAKSLLHFKKIPWRNAMICGWGLSATGQKLSKSKSNGGTLEPLATYEKYSADVTRYWASNASLGKDVYIREEEFNNGFKLMQKLWNASKFVLPFLDGYKYSKPSKLEKMDTWIIECYKNAFTRFVSNLEKYEMGLALGELESIFWNFCDNYIEIAKNRLYKPEIYGEKAKASAQYAASTVLLGLLKMFSIYMPHVTEEIYQEFKNIEDTPSIHTSKYLVLDGKADQDIITKGNEVCDIVSNIRGYKSQNNLSLKTEIETVTISGASEFVKECEQDIKAVCAINNLVFKDGQKDIKIN